VAGFFDILFAKMEEQLHLALEATGIAVHLDTSVTVEFYEMVVLGGEHQLFFAVGEHFFEALDDPVEGDKLRVPVNGKDFTLGGEGSWWRVCCSLAHRGRGFVVKREACQLRFFLHPPQRTPPSGGSLVEREDAACISQGQPATIGGEGDGEETFAGFAPRGELPGVAGRPEMESLLARNSQITPLCRKGQRLDFALLGRFQGLEGWESFLLHQGKGNSTGRGRGGRRGGRGPFPAGPSRLAATSRREGTLLAGRRETLWRGRATTRRIAVTLR